MKSVVANKPEVSSKFEHATLGLRMKMAVAFGAIYLIWGSTFLATRFAVTVIPPFFVSGTRFFVAGVVLFAFARMRSKEELTWRNWRAAMLLGALFFLICHGGVSWAARHVPSGISALLMASISMWTAVIELVRRSEQRPGRLVIISLLGGFVGMTLLVAKPQLLAGSRVGSLGAAVVLVGAFSWALGTVLTRNMDLPSSTLLSASMQMICGGGLLLVLGLATGQAHDLHVSAITRPALLGMLFLTFIGSLAGFSCYVWLLSVASPTRVATYAYVNPIVALFLGWAMAGEQLTERSFIASLIVVASVAVIISSRESASTPRPAVARLPDPEPSI